MREILTTTDIADAFLGTSIRELNEEVETPNINFLFNGDGYDYFNSLINDSEFRLHKPYQEDLDYLIEHYDEDCLDITVHDHELFFNLLNQIIEEQIKLFIEYGDNVISRETAIYLLRRIWLRLGVSDFDHIEDFLSKQLEFVTNRTFDTQTPRLINTYEGYNVYMKTVAKDMWNETTRGMIFTIGEDEHSYELPHILYDIDATNTCYIYGVQNSQSENKDKRIGRKLYKLNKGIEGPNVHPSKVCALLLFINELKKKGITKIVVPGIQVLSYHYHELLSHASRVNLEEAIQSLEKNPTDRFLRDRVDYYKSWYDRVHDKQDIISFLKTEELYNLLYRITEHDPDFEILNDVMVQGEDIKIRIK